MFGHWKIPTVTSRRCSLRLLTMATGVQHGANVNGTDLWQFSPLHEAASKSRLEVCSLLLSHGADAGLLNCHSKSPLAVAPTRELHDRLLCECHGRLARKVSRL